MHFDGLIPPLGHSFRSSAAREAWMAMLHDVAEHVRANDLQEEILFHGTTKRRAGAILRKGMNPTIAWEETPDGDVKCEGSFWGTLRTAAWYAEDSAAHRAGGAPTIIACRASFIATYAALRIDIPTRDWPVPGLMTITDDEFVERWATGRERDWRDSLAELGSCTALHDYAIEMPEAVMLTGIESLERILDSRSFSP